MIHTNSSLIPTWTLTAGTLSAPLQQQHPMPLEPSETGPQMLYAGMEWITAQGQSIKCSSKEGNDDFVYWNWMSGCRQPQWDSHGAEHARLTNRNGNSGLPWTKQLQRQVFAGMTSAECTAEPRTPVRRHNGANGLRQTGWQNKWQESGRGDDLKYRCRQKSRLGWEGGWGKDRLDQYCTLVDVRVLCEGNTQELVVEV